MMFKMIYFQTLSIEVQSCMMRREGDRERERRSRMIEEGCSTTERILRYLENVLCR